MSKLVQLKDNEGNIFPKTLSNMKLLGTQSISSKVWTDITLSDSKLNYDLLFCVCKQFEWLNSIVCLPNDDYSYGNTGTAIDGNYIFRVQTNTGNNKTIKVYTSGSANPCRIYGIKF